jgi:hypothetical protein
LLLKIEMEWQEARDLKNMFSFLHRIDSVEGEWQRDW